MTSGARTLTAQEDRRKLELTLIGRRRVTSEKWPCCWAGAPPSGRSRLMSGTPCLRRCAARGVDAHAFDPRDRDLRELKQRGLRPRLHRTAWTLWRGRHRAGRARAAGHALYRQRRDGVSAGNGQVCAPSWSGSPPAFLRRGTRCCSASRLDRAGCQARAAADREACARGFHHRPDQGRDVPKNGGGVRGWRRSYDRLVLAEEFVAGTELTAASSAIKCCR